MPSLANRCHHHEHALRADGQIHRAADRGNGVRRAGVPVGQIPALTDLECAEDTDVEMAAAHHREGVGVVEVRRARGLGDGDLARVGQIRVDGVADGFAAHAEHAVLGVQHHICFGRQVVGDGGGLADTEVDVRAGRDVTSDDGGQFPTVQRAAVEMLDRDRSRRAAS